MKTSSWIIAAAALCLAACLFDKAPEEVDLTLPKAPAGTDYVIVSAVDRSDTNIIVEEKLFSGDYTPGMTLHFGLGKVQGREAKTLLRVEGYRDSLLVYLSLIAPGRNSTDEVLFPDVTQGWPTIAFTRFEKVGDNYVLTTATRGRPVGPPWRVGPNVPVPNQLHLVSTGNAFTLGPTGLVAGTWITAELLDTSDTSKVLPVQVPDSLLTDELLAPSGATVEILDAQRVADTATQADSVVITLDVKNFTRPSKDEPIPGKGWAKVLDARGLRPIPDFAAVGNDISRIVGPSWRLAGVTNIVVALHYANGSRVRPLISDTVEAAIALVDRRTLPTVKIASHSANGTNIRCNLTRTNITGEIHVHIYRDQVLDKEYELCRTAVCDVQPNVWTGAKRLIAVVVTPTHGIFTPQSRDTLNAPFF